MPSRGFEPGSVYFDKKSNGKDKIQTSALPTYMSYAAKLQNSAIFHYTC